MPLSTLIAEFVNQELIQKNHNEIYAWAVNEKFLPERIFIQGTNNLEKNLSLKYSLHKAWIEAENNQQRRCDLIRYYISIWGGIKGNSSQTMNIYTSADADTLISRGLKGIASWSKALVLHNPDIYAIYDVRVVAAINYLQLLSANLEEKRRYVIISAGRNKKINQANSLINSSNLFKNWIVLHTDLLYTKNYLPLLRESAELINTNISTIEMILFNSAPLLAEQIIEKYG
jgi:hypothetical protein